MLESNQIPLLFYLIALIAVFSLAYNLRRFFFIRIGKGKTEIPLNFFSGLSNLFTFGIGQRKVVNPAFTYASIMHFFLGWGFIELFFATTVDFFTTRRWFISYLPELDTPWFAFINDLGGLMLFAGLVMALYRRHLNKPALLPHNSFKGRGNTFGDTGILLFLILIVAGGFISEAARLAVEQPPTAHWSWIGYPLSKTMSLSTWQAAQSNMWWSHAILSLLFIAIFPLTKMFHTLSALVNVALANREYLGRTKPMYVSRLMEDSEVDVDTLTFGAGKIEDFSWKQLLDGITCTECGRCTTVCPAHITNKPLSPMKIVTDIRQELYSKAMNKSGSEELVGGIIDDLELWSCTTCGACIAECPVLIDPISPIIEMRRHLILSEGRPPAQANDSLEKTRNYGNPWGFPKDDRIKWATDAGIDLPVMAEKKRAKILYWVGCAGSFDPRNQKVSRAMVKILNSAGVDYAALGNEETCTGDSARRLGEEYLFETMAEQNIKTLNQYEFETIVTACPHCFNTLGNEYSTFGGSYNVLHHTQFINQLINSGKLKPEKHISEKITYHDSCYLGRFNGEYNAPREIIKKVLDDGGALTEMDRNKDRSFCCGAGGGNMWHEVNKGEKINLNRFQEALDTGSDTIATACSFCMVMIDDAMKMKGKEDSMRVLDIAEIVAQGLK